MKRGGVDQVRVQAVVFDLFNTLTAPVDDEVYMASIRAMGLAAGVDPDGFTRGWFDLWRERFDGTFGTPDDDVRGVCAAMEAPVEAAAVERAVEIREQSLRNTLKPRADAVATLARLRALGFKTALISDCSADLPNLWPTTPYAALIDVPVFSCVEGLIKPDPRIYRRACERLGSAAENCVYVGDGGNHELTGAMRVGMRAVLITTPEERAAAYDRSERRSWRGEAIEALSELPKLIADGRRT
ncbi:MAG: HAD family hydrolase [Chloroflexi bacterium]|nr:HAD family hydrolase [Chloroflexota bacterium]